MIPRKHCRLEDCDEDLDCCKYCTPRHMRRAQYLKMKSKGYWDKRYKKLQRQWEKSATGKRAGMPIREWLKIPEDFR